MLVPPQPTLKAKPAVFYSYAAIIRSITLIRPVLRAAGALNRVVENESSGEGLSKIRLMSVFLVSRHAPP